MTEKLKYACLFSGLIIATLLMYSIANAVIL